jgi:hypothetical protein
MVAKPGGIPPPATSMPGKQLVFRSGNILQITPSIPWAHCRAGEGTGPTKTPQKYFSKIYLGRDANGGFHKPCDLEKLIFCPPFLKGGQGGFHGNSLKIPLNHPLKRGTKASQSILSGLIFCQVNCQTLYYSPLSSSRRSTAQVLGTSLGASLGLPQLDATGTAGGGQHPHARMAKDRVSIALAFRNILC